MRVVVGLALLAGCGRYGFDHGASDAAVDASGDAAVDAETDAPVVAPVCGDSVCEGNAGELCSGCAADCATRDPVCGNGACDPGESPACTADCGPSPWPFGAEETMLLARVNAVRATGYACPNGARAAVGAIDAGTSTAAAREWTWEIAHQRYAMPGGTTCNGRTFNERSNNGSTYRNAIDTGSDTIMTVDDAVVRWLSNPALCDALLDGTYAAATAGVAHDVANGYVLLLQ